MGELKMNRAEMYFKPAGSKDLVHVGSCDPKDVLMTTTTVIGDKALIQEVSPGHHISMQAATCGLAAFVIGRR